MSDNPNIYKFEEDETSNYNNPSRDADKGMQIPINSIKDIGNIPLPKDKEMSKWFVVIATIVVLGALWFVGSWVNNEMKFKNEQIKLCNENFQNLNVKFVLKDQELQQLMRENNKKNDKE